MTKAGDRKIIIAPYRLSIVLAAPILGIAWLTVVPRNVWQHEWRLNVVFDDNYHYQFGQTLGLMLGVAVSVIWLAFRHGLWHSSTFRVAGIYNAAVTPLAMPTYIAVCVCRISRQLTFYQKWVSIFGSHAWYPQLTVLAVPSLRSIVLYPCVYMSARTGFINQSELMQQDAYWVRHIGEFSSDGSRITTHIIVGALAMMGVNDIGAVEHLVLQRSQLGFMKRLSWQPWRCCQNCNAAACGLI